MNAMLSLSERADAAAAVAATHADAVDREGRFPREAIAACRDLGLLGLLVPETFGGPGASLAEAALVCRKLGRSCGSTALIHAMHQIQVACMVACGRESVWAQDFLRRVAREQTLLASVTSEVGVGGNIRQSLCAPIVDGDRISLRKACSAISYGLHADALLVTARRHADAAGSDQVVIVAGRDDAQLSETGRWDTLGMRGTDSRAFDLELRVAAEQILPMPFSELAQTVMLPTSHILWGAAWLGIASDAAERARAFLRREAQMNPDRQPPAAIRFERAASLLATMRTRLESAIASHAKLDPAGTDAPPLGFQTEINALKVALSELGLEIVQQAMQICGISGYKNGTAFSLGRHLRDLQSAPLMVSNDRIVANTATMLIAQRAQL